MPRLRFHISVKLINWVGGSESGGLAFLPHSCLCGPAPLLVPALALPEEADSSC